MFCTMRTYLNRNVRFCFYSLLFLAATVVLVPVQSAQACGGFFCNAVTLSPIYQAGERLVFHRQGETVTMHVEIMYDGEPTDFGWLLPLPAIPEDELGNPLPLEEILKISTGDLFNILQGATDPIYQVNTTFEDACNQMLFGSGPAANESDGRRGEPNAPDVEVLQEANIGPFGAQLIEATSAAGLYAWLEEKGYLQDPNAEQLLEHYTDQGYVFLGLRLQSGKSSGDIRPVQLNLGDTDACIPLRLTSIAATDDMPMLVWVLGEHRAIPKNFMHAVVNHKALQWPGGTNYFQVVTDAVNSVEGRAFVTEFAGSAPDLADSFYSEFLQNQRENLQNASTLEQVLSVINSVGGSSNTELRSLLESFVQMPDGLTGYPFGDCYFDFDFSKECEDNDEHETTTDEFYAAVEYWLAMGAEIEADVDGLKDSMEETFFAVREGIRDMFNNAQVVTRFFTTISGDEMEARDPIFAFNPDLELLDRTNNIEAVIKSDEDCDESWIEATYEDGTMRIISCDDVGCFGTPTIPPLDGEPALHRVEIIDESGDPRAFDPETAEEVDQLLNNATVGTPTLPENYELTPPQTVSTGSPKPGFGNPGQSSSGGGLCSTGTEPSSAPLVLFGGLLLGLAVSRRFSWDA